MQSRFQPLALFLELDFFSRELFQPDDIALFLQIERGDFIPQGTERLCRAEGIGLGLTQTLLALTQFVFHFSQRFLPGGERLPVLVQGSLGGRQLA